MQHPAHRQLGLVDELVPRILADPRFVGVALSGSLAKGAPDEFSDVDLVVVVHDESFDEVLRERLQLIGGWAPLVAGFTGEHVGEPRLIIALVGPPVLHVDFTFLRRSDLAGRAGRPVPIADPTGALARELAEHPPLEAVFDPQWIEDRFWVWVHYGATKLGRGELFELLDMLAFLRGTVLGPLAARRAGLEPRGVRRLEQDAPAEALALRATVCGYDAQAACTALLASIELYRAWRVESMLERRDRAEHLATAYLAEVSARLE